MGAGLVHVADLDEFVVECDRRGGISSPDSTSYVADFSLAFATEVDDSIDGFSPHYESMQLELYRELAGREIDQTANEQAEQRAFAQRRLDDCDFVYVWADGVHFNVRLEEARLCCLVIVGVRADGTKELVAITDGHRESTDSWADLLRDLKRLGMRAPMVAVGDGALGFWAAVRTVWPETTEGRLTGTASLRSPSRPSRPRDGCSPRSATPRTATMPSRPSTRSLRSLRVPPLTGHRGYAARLVRAAGLGRYWFSQTMGVW